jgi:hypothetical protein
MPVKMEARIKAETFLRINPMVPVGKMEDLFRAKPINSQLLTSIPPRINLLDSIFSPDIM